MAVHRFCPDHKKRLKNEDFALLVAACENSTERLDFPGLGAAWEQSKVDITSNYHVPRILPTNEIMEEYQGKKLPAVGVQ